MKCSVLSRQIAQDTSGRFAEILVHSGQHYDHGMSAAFFEDLGIPEPLVNLDVRSSTQAEQTGLIMVGLEKVISDKKPDLVLVYGDTNTTLAAAVVAAKFPIPIAHVEAGLRSYRKGMSEEINRVVTDQLSDFLFCPSKVAKKNLQREGKVENVFVTGDIMLDIFLETLEKVDHDLMLREFGLERHKFFLVTIHRAENVDCPVTLKAIMRSLDDLARCGLPVVLPLHPRTRKSIENLNLRFSNIRFMEPVNYLKMAMLVSNARCVITDSGGLQKEAYFANTKCITLRDETEWIETLEGGHNTLVPPCKVETLVDLIQSDFQHKKLNFPPIYGTGDSGRKTFEILAKLIDA